MPATQHAGELFWGEAVGRVMEGTGSSGSVWDPDRDPSSGADCRARWVGLVVTDGTGSSG